MGERRFWIRKDREDYFLGGVVVACVVGGFVSAYWHFNDRVMVKKNIKIKAELSKEAEHKKLRDLQFVPSKLKVGDKEYYKMDEETAPSVPKPGDDE